MKRSETLAPLSREHHVALALALSLRRAGPRDAGVLADRAREFWETESREHFRLEEEILIPPFARHVGAEDPDIERLQADHAELRGRFTSLAAPASPEALRDLGRRLAEHIRFEERRLFGRIETELDPEELDQVARALKSSHTPPGPG